MLEKTQGAIHRTDTKSHYDHETPEENPTVKAKSQMQRMRQAADQNNADLILEGAEQQPILNFR